MSQVLHLILVTGPSGSGKTELGLRLAKRFQLPLFSSDALKETLFDIVGSEDRSLVNGLAAASYELLYHLIEEMLRSGKSVIGESVFWQQPNSVRFRELLAKYPATVTQVHCTAEPEVLFDRILQREASPDRHSGHGQKLLSERTEFVEEIESGKYGPLNLDGELIVVDTTDFAVVDFSSTERTIERRITA